jgi:hypothetical protein
MEFTAPRRIRIGGIERERPVQSHFGRHSGCTE